MLLRTIRFRRAFLSPGCGGLGRSLCFLLIFAEVDSRFFLTAGAPFFFCTAAAYRAVVWKAEVVPPEVVAEGSLNFDNVRKRRRQLAQIDIFMVQAEVGTTIYQLALSYCPDNTFDDTFCSMGGRASYAN